tara:strand:- start:16177 stop:16701 length:525 start_codon:yes stop_codon:yes gene_type:complete
MPHPVLWKFGIAIAAIPGLFILGIALPYGVTAFNWFTLSKAELVSGVESFRWRYDGPNYSSLGNAYACLYAVSCETDRPKLVPITDLENWDFKSTKSTIWKRRFSNECPGRTANFGLHWVDASDSEIPGFLENAYWSFFNDRFLMRHGRFNSGSFSEEPWQRCTPEIAILSPRS